MNTIGQDHFSPEATGLDYYPNSPHNLLDDVLIDAAAPALDAQQPVVIDQTINNRNRSVGAMLSNVISRRHGASGLPDGTITVNLTGHTGQSFGFTLARGVSLHVTGDANDGCGKGLSGGEIVVSPGEAVLAGGLVAEDNVIVGNVALYGATSGSAFFRGKGGERFCVRNSGALAVVEGIGDHGCEYMTGGRMVCLGPTGINFAAGMSGGVAYIYDPHGTFPPNCNTDMVDLEAVEPRSAEADELRGYIEAHAAKTGSSVAGSVLSDWERSLPSFVKVMPEDYKRVLQEAAAKEAAKVVEEGLRSAGTATGRTAAL